MKRGKAKTDVPKKADSKLAVRKRSERASKKPKMTKAGKDPNKPKRPPSAFFVFMRVLLFYWFLELCIPFYGLIAVLIHVWIAREEFRKTFKEQHPNNKSVSVVGKAAGDKWKSMSEDDKAPFVDKAAKLKTEYTKKIATYNKNQAEGASRPADVADEDQSDKSKSDAHDDEEDGEGSEEEEDEEDD